MKILILTDYFYPHWTGISKSIYNLVKIKINELKFDVLTTKYNNDLDNQDVISKTTIYREPFIFSVSRVKYSINIIFKFILLIRNYDGVLINSPYSNILVISLLTKIFNKKLFIFHQGDLILPKGFVNVILEKIFDISSILSFFISNKIATYTRDYAEHSRVIKPFLYKFTPLLMPVIINKKNVNEKNLIYQKLFELKKRKKIIFGFAGRFVEEKGFDILLNAIPKITKKNSKIHFVFAGDTEITYENFYEKNQSKISLIKKNLTMLGLLNETDLQNFYYMIDFIIIPSRSDCFNLVQAEAMLFGRPSIVSNIHGARYLVNKTGFGVIFEKNSHIDLEAKIISTVKDKINIRDNYQKVTQVLEPNKIKNNITEFFLT